VPQLNFKAILWQHRTGPVGPFNRCNYRPGQVFFQSDRLDLAQRVKAIEIDVSQMEPAAIFVDKHKGRAADIFL
jgi:hypothetical protein